MNTRPAPHRAYTPPLTSVTTSSPRTCTLAGEQRINSGDVVGAAQAWDDDMVVGVSPALHINAIDVMLLWSALHINALPQTPHCHSSCLDGYRGWLGPIYGRAR